jgi:hypothetical protein
MSGSVVTQAGVLDVEVVQVAKEGVMAA